MFDSFEYIVARINKHDSLLNSFEIEVSYNLKRGMRNYLVIDLLHCEEPLLPFSKIFCQLTNILGV